MRTTEMARLFQASGPFLSLYLATGGDVDNAGPTVGLRWKNARSDLLEQGVPERLLEAVDPLVGGSYTAGATLAVVATVEGVLWSENLPNPPPRDVVARWDALPAIVPLLAHFQSLVPHVAVLASRAEAELVARTVEGNGDEQVEVEGERSPYLTRSAPGGWSQPRYQHRAEVLWERNAAEVAGVLTEMVDHVRPRFVAVAGDVRAVQFLRDKSPKRVRELMETVGGELPSIEAVLEEAAKLVAATAERDTLQLLDRFEQERGQHDLAADGVAETFRALAMAQVETLLVSELPNDERTAWFGATGQSVALDRETLLAIGEVSPAEGRLVDVAVRAALTSGAGVRILEPRDPDDTHQQRGPREGLGALLRFTTG
jgi:Bacterial archaeo-eukaryotic release factor family 2